MIYYTIAYISALTPIIPILFWSANFKNKQKIGFIIFLICVLSLVSDSLYYTLPRLTNISSVDIILNIFDYCNFLLLSYLFFRVNMISRVFLSLMTLTYFLFALISHFFLQPIEQYQNYCDALGSLILTCYGIIVMVKMMKDVSLETYQLHRQVMWIIFGIFFYFGFNFFLFATDEWMFQESPLEVQMLLWSFHNVNNIIKNAFYSAGIYYANKPIRSNQD